ncbi:MAG: M15 family metallopeptidase [Deltaproteobacteria bacterium]|nr:M15 family metallopeptidase [Deltaproteobacteria bacterium]
MSTFSPQSLARLSTCHPDLQRLFTEVIKHRDCTVLCGHRTQAEQDQAVAEGHSKTPWPKSRHNALPSLAADVAPFPLDWADRSRFIEFAHFVLGVAATLGISITWGGDWDRDGVPDKFFDGPHFQLEEK